MKTFIITAHIEFAPKLTPIPPQQPIQTGLFRMEVPAETEAEARRKARQFIKGKTAIVIDSCISKPAEQASPGNKSFEHIMTDFRNMFGEGNPGK